MCTEVKDKNIYIITEDTVAWKICRKTDAGTYRSRYAPEGRSLNMRWRWLEHWYVKIPWPDGRGRDITYRVGKMAKSKWPGIFCYEKEPVKRHSFASNRAFKVIIPKGTEVVYGYDSLEHAFTVCAQQVMVHSAQKYYDEERAA
jgi:hypothetical protein